MASANRAMAVINFSEQIWPRLGGLVRNPYVSSELLIESMKHFGEEGVRYIETQTLVWALGLSSNTKIRDGNSLSLDAASVIWGVLEEVRPGDGGGAVPRGLGRAARRGRRRARPGGDRPGWGRPGGLGAQRDVDRRDAPGAPAAGVRWGAGCDRRDVGGRRAAGRHGRGRRLLLRPACSLSDGASDRAMKPAAQQADRVQ